MAVRDRPELWHILHVRERLPGGPPGFSQEKIIPFLITGAFLTISGDSLAFSGRHARGSRTCISACRAILYDEAEFG